MLFNRTSPLTLTYAGAGAEGQSPGRSWICGMRPTRRSGTSRIFTTGQLSIGVSHTRGRFILPEILPVYQAQFPALSCT